jgi:NAD(P)-dependent dehydrogenase (short-subunit alcohol dehydrogenase family)
MTAVGVEPALLRQTVVVIGGTAGIGLEAARRAHLEGAAVVVTGRDPGRLDRAAADLQAHGAAAFDATDPAALARFFGGLDDPVDHVLVTAGGPRYGRMLEMTDDEAREALSDHMVLSIQVARHAARTVRPGGSLLLVGGTGARHITIGSGIASAVTAAMPALTASLALELAPVRVNLIAPGFVDTPLSAAILGEGLDARREELRRKLPIGRVVGPADVGALAVHLMTNTAITGATYDVDGGQQFIA